MNEMIIYKNEIKDGLKDILKSKSSIAYCTPLKPWQYTEEQKAKVIASLPSFSLPNIDLKCLYPTQSLLVTSNWNGNDDVFPKVDTWIARNTPLHKPTNDEHDENQIVGHMITSWVIDNDNNIIPDDTSISDVPNVFHICNGAVIYKTWESPELTQRTEKLIAAIQANKKFVSMECWFTNFDYAVLGSDNAFHVVARNDDTSFLTKHLRAYGGNGEHEGYRIGRLLRNITFTGKGYVDKPANPNSIIFSSSSSNLNVDFASVNKDNPFDNGAGVYISVADVGNKDDDMENSLMADNVLQNQIDELKQELSLAKKSNKDLNDKLAEANVKEYESTIDDLKSQLSNANTKIEEFETTKSELETQVNELTNKVGEVTKANEELVAKIAEVEAEKLTASRVSTLVDGGLDKEVATEKVKLFSNLNDEQFTFVASELIEAVKAKMDKDDKEEDKEDKKKEDKSKSNAEADEDNAESVDASIVDNAEADDDVTDAVASESDDETDSVRAAISDFFEKSLFGGENK